MSLIADPEHLIEVDVPDEPPPASSGRFSQPSTPLANLTGSDLAVLAAVFVIPCAYLPMLAVSSWSARMIVLLALAPMGVWALWRLVRLGDVAARWATAALGWCLIAALFSGNVSASLRGSVGQDLSVLSVAAVFGLWALSRFMSESGRRLVAPAVIAAAGLNVFIGLMQVVFQITDGDLALLYGRAVGLTPNPVYFGALVAGAAALCLHQASATTAARRGAWLVGVFVFAVGVALSGSRVALGVLVLVALYGVWRFDRRWATVAAATAAVGSVLGSQLVRVRGADNDSISRLGQGGSDGRFTYWRAAGDAVVERPVTGWGLGRFRFATQGRFSIEEMLGLNSAFPFTDAHNIVIGLAVAVGLPGLVLFAGFVWSSARTMRPALAAVAGAIAITWLMQPVVLSTLPLVMVMLGVSSRPAPGQLIGSGGPGRAGLAVGIVAGLVPAAWLGYAEFQMYSAIQSGDVVAVRDAGDLYLDDASISNLVGRFAEPAAPFDEQVRDDMLAAYRRSTELEPGRAHWWIERARHEGAFGDPEGAQFSAERAVALDPYNPQAWTVLRLVGIDLDDRKLETEALTVLCALSSEGACDDLEQLELTSASR